MNISSAFAGIIPGKARQILSTAGQDPTKQDPTSALTLKTGMRGAINWDFNSLLLALVPETVDARGEPEPGSETVDPKTVAQGQAAQVSDIKTQLIPQTTALSLGDLANTSIKIAGAQAANPNSSLTRPQTPPSIRVVPRFPFAGVGREDQTAEAAPAKQELAVPNAYTAAVPITNTGVPQVKEQDIDLVEKTISDTLSTNSSPTPNTQPLVLDQIKPLQSTRPEVRRESASNTELVARSYGLDANISASPKTTEVVEYHPQALVSTVASSKEDPTPGVHPRQAPSQRKDADISTPSFNSLRADNFAATLDAAPVTSIPVSTLPLPGASTFRVPPSPISNGSTIMAVSVQDDSKPGRLIRDFPEQTLVKSPSEIETSVASQPNVENVSPATRTSVPPAPTPDYEPKLNLEANQKSVVNTPVIPRVPIDVQDQPPQAQPVAPNPPSAPVEADEAANKRTFSPLLPDVFASAPKPYPIPIDISRVRRPEKRFDEPSTLPVTAAASFQDAPIEQSVPTPPATDPRTPAFKSTMNISELPVPELKGQGEKALPGDSTIAFTGRLIPRTASGDEPVSRPEPARTANDSSNTSRIDPKVEKTSTTSPEPQAAPSEHATRVQVETTVYHSPVRVEPITVAPTIGRDVAPFPTDHNVERAPLTPRTLVEVPAEPVNRDPAGPVREISLRFNDQAQESAHLRVVDKGGEVLVTVRSGSEQLARSLSSDLGELTHRLDQTGFQAELYRPSAHSSSSEFGQDRRDGSSTAGQNGGQSWSRDRRDSQQHSGQQSPDWTDLEESMGLS